MNLPNNPKSVSRLREISSILAVFVDNLHILSPIVAVIGLGVCLLDVNIGLSVLVFALLLFSYWADRKHLGFMIFPPIAMYAFYGFISVGIGPLCYVLSGMESEMSDYLTIIQVAYLVGFTAMLLGYVAVQWREAPFKIPDFRMRNLEQLYRPLAATGMILILFSCLAEAVLLYTGAGDRGYAGEVLLYSRFGFFTYFLIFQRYLMLAFFFLPLILRVYSNPIKYAMILLVLVYLIFGFASGSRGRLLYPIAYIIAGYWMFGQKEKRIIPVLLITGVLAIAIIPIMHYYRISAGFYETKQLNILDRLSAVTEISDKASLVDDSAMGILAVALIGEADYLVYANTPSAVPFVGLQDFERIIYIWVPTFFYRAKRTLSDGYEIVVNYDYSKFFERHSVGISFNADLYRRSGWWGIIIGNVLYGVLFGFICKYTFAYYRKNQLIGLQLVILLQSQLYKMQSSTVLTTFERWGYDFVKHAIMIVVLTLLVRALVARQSRT